jgi:hypothetical protein
MERIDAPLFRAALVTEVGAFERLKVLSFGYTRAELVSEGIAWLLRFLHHRQRGPLTPSAADQI